MKVIAKYDDQKHQFSFADFTLEDTSVIPVGVNDEKEIVYWDMDETYSVLISGASGSGKTTLAKLVAFLSCFSYPLDKTCLFIYSSKPFEYKRFNDLPQMGLSVISDIKQFENIARRLVLNIRENRKHGIIPDYHTIIAIDDLDDMPLSSLSEQLKKDLDDLLRCGRESRVHCLLVINTPSEEYISKQMMRSFHKKVTFATATPSLSMLAIGQDGAEGLDYPGEALIKTGETIERISVPEFPQEIENNLIDAVARYAKSRGIVKREVALPEIEPHEDEKKTSPLDRVQGAITHFKDRREEKKEEKMKMQREQRENRSFSSVGTCRSGLQMARGTSVSVRYSKEGFRFANETKIVELPFEQITNVQVIDSTTITGLGRGMAAGKRAIGGTIGEIAGGISALKYSLAITYIPQSGKGGEKRIVVFFDSNYSFCRKVADDFAMRNTKRVSITRL